HPTHRGKGKGTVKVREKLPAARDLVFERCSELFRLHRYEKEVILAGKVLSGGLLHLLGGREVDEPVGEVHRRAQERSFPLGLPPERGSANLVDQIRHDRAIGRTVGEWKWHQGSGGSLCTQIAAQSFVTVKSSDWRKTDAESTRSHSGPRPPSLGGRSLGPGGRAIPAGAHGRRLCAHGYAHGRDDALPGTRGRACLPPRLRER